MQRPVMDSHVVRGLARCMRQMRAITPDAGDA
jgi:hypothetical protein